VLLVVSECAVPSIQLQAFTEKLFRKPAKITVTCVIYTEVMFPDAPKKIHRTSRTRLNNETLV
jgi:hypothetical protein